MCIRALKETVPVAVFDYLWGDLGASLFARWERIERPMCFSFFLPLSWFVQICLSFLSHILRLSIWLRTVSCNTALCIFAGGGSSNTHTHTEKCVLIICTLQIYNTAIPRLGRGRDPGRTLPACLPIYKVRISHLGGDPKNIDDFANITNECWDVDKYPFINISSRISSSSFFWARVKQSSRNSDALQTFSVEFARLFMQWRK